VSRSQYVGERLGFRSLWLYDHLYTPGVPDRSSLEGWTLATALLTSTTTLRVGHLVLDNNLRHPALLAKMAATLDNITKGRVIVGLGAGWFEMEFTGYGFDFPALPVRLQQLDEAAELLKKLWTEEQPSFSGKHFRVEHVFCEPKPLQKPHPPILIGGGGERVLLRIAARHADIWNNLAVSQPELAHKVQVLRDHCRALGRDPNSIQVSQQTMVVLGGDRAEADAKREKAQMVYGGHLGHGIVGTPEECIEKIRQHIADGCTMFIMEFFGRDTREPARLFAETVMPAFAGCSTGP